ncbi:hypothetical protein TTHERM_00734040 (macronuclear) [Tetrahymena thermophila SB210]|uniref:Uncharacterized protein n=1 Tax=Tetrahymena thermophila (strain SB210) TaxID=312017 RepID=Q231Z3_TETTS|nr:hypothetical protein TTHERM_00734040 [Tetrahymena thermophila SB210]EAR91307.2 hypothetical protein TTHERM_00734040 [Tetrahymena thermophila SB210]|eukprot:XP_001011552.2 hypothetical protein TTHERM_00734040 [Tetrahymena thermophila SB210]
MKGANTQKNSPVKSKIIQNLQSSKIQIIEKYFSISKLNSMEIKNYWILQLIQQKFPKISDIWFGRYKVILQMMDKLALLVISQVNQLTHIDQKQQLIHPILQITELFFCQKALVNQRIYIS